MDSVLTRPVVVVNTYNRPSFFRRLLGDIVPEIEAIGGELWVVDDGSEPDYASGLCRSIKAIPCQVHRHRHHGKAEYWRLWDATIQSLHAAGVREACFLPDDVRLKPGALEQLRRTWQMIADLDPAAVTLNPLVDRRGRGPNWTIMTPGAVTLRGGSVVWHTGWFDLCGWVDHRFLDTIDRVIEVPRDWLQYIGSSGVGAQITMILWEKRLRMYQVETSLVEHGTHKSMMHPHERMVNPL
jgi:hypothetical protein